METPNRTRNIDPIRSQAGRIGAYTMHSRNDPREVTKKARAKFMESFYKEVDPENQLTQDERDRRATLAKKAYFARLALKSAKARGRAATNRSLRHANRQIRPDGAE